MVAGDRAGCLFLVCVRRFRQADRESSCQPDRIGRGHRIQRCHAEPGRESDGESIAQPSLSAREQQVLPFIPPQYLAGCGPGVGLAGRAQVACDVPEVGRVTYILYDSPAAMIADYEDRYSLMDLNAEGIPTCNEGPYSRPYAGDTRVQAGRRVCFINAAIPHVAWSDEDLGIIAVANSPAGEMTLEGTVPVVGAARGRSVPRRLSG